MAATQSVGFSWLFFALTTVLCWGVYGILLHSGQVSMGDPALGRYKAFLLVGIAYFVTAVLAPLFLLVRNGASLSFPAQGVLWSFLAGIVGAVGAFCMLLAFGAGGIPSAVMSIVFAGAPVVNAIVALTLHPPVGGWMGLRWQFIAGILLAALGAFLVTSYKPNPAPPSSSSQILDPADPRI